MSSTPDAVRRRLLPIAAATAVLVSALVAPVAASASPERPASVPRQWTARQEGGQITGVVVDPGLHQVYVIGQGSGTHARDIAVVAYASNGRLLWSAFYGDGSTVTPAAAVLDPADHRLLVTGSTASDGDSDVVTVAFDARGRQLWASTWSGPAGSTRQLPEVAVALAVDTGNHRVVVAGYRTAAQSQAITVAYDADGHELWDDVYTGNPTGSAAAAAVAVDPVSHAVVVGGSSAAAPGAPLGFVTLAYDGDGHRRWVDRYEPDVPGGSQINDVAIDPGTHAVYVTGNSIRQLTLFAYDADGHRLWTVGGGAAGGGGPLSNGTLLLVDAGTHAVYVVGSGRYDGGGGLNQYLTFRYDPDGTQRWVRGYGGSRTLFSDCLPTAAALDPVTHDVYVTGTSFVLNRDDEMATVGYHENGSRVFDGRPFITRAGGPSGYDAGQGIAVDPGRGVYAAGLVFQDGTAGWTTIAF